MAASTKDKTVGFFSGRGTAERSEGPSLLPTTRKEGAPKENKWLVQFAEDSVEIRHSGDDSKNPGHPYLAFSLSVVEPVEFENRKVFGMMYFPADPDEDCEDDVRDQIIRSQKEFGGDIDHILGEGTFDGTPGDDLTEVLENLAYQLDSIICVAKIGKEKEKNGFPAKNKVYNFYAGDTWASEDEDDS